MNRPAKPVNRRRRIHASSRNGRACRRACVNGHGERAEPGRARRLSGQHAHDLRQLPHAEGPDGCRQFDKALSGGLRFDEPPFDVTASNITPDQETGIGSWSEADIKKAHLNSACGRTACRCAEIMPSAFYQILTAARPRRASSPICARAGGEQQGARPGLQDCVAASGIPRRREGDAGGRHGDKVKRGFYLVTIAHCLECHTPFGPHGTASTSSNSLGKGGREFHGPWGVSVSRNITSSKTKGIGDWSDAEIKRAITQGVRKDGSTLKPPMGYPYYAKMTDADLDAMRRLSADPAGEGVSATFSAARGRPSRRRRRRARNRR